MIRRLVLLGSTGSIGQSTLDVLERYPDRFRLLALTANKNSERVIRQIKKFKPRVVAMADAGAARQVQTSVRAWKNAPRVLAGPEGILRAAAWPGAQVVVSAIVGTAGLLPTLEAIRCGRDIALANKETLVMAGALVMAAVRRQRVKLLPVDSEHAALAHCLSGQAKVPVRRLILTASGGPFANFSAAALNKVTVEQALKHPTWSMGRKITVDSATLMNKGLELIEAHHLFQVPYDRIEVVVHPQSIVHSMVEYVDGSILAQMASPDMRLPIQTALTDPEKIASLVKPLDFAAGLSLTFGPPDGRRFPCLPLAYRAGQEGGTAPAVLNAANEIAVQAFLEKKLDFSGIPRVISRVLARHENRGQTKLEPILAADAWARAAAEEEITCKHCK
jgi:1-deoxy-D-xylulose-5-phosphate reductoisomerase